jgi:cysteine-rich repeat protein
VEATRLAAALALVLAAGPTAFGAAPRAASGSACVGRYVFLRASGRLVDRTRDMIVLDATSAVIDPACGAATVAYRPVRHGTRIVARWAPCRGARVLRLRLRASADCTLLRGTVTGHGRSSRIVAVTSTCGDGVVDPGRGERCDDGNLVDGDGCDSRCGACSGPTAFAATWDAIQTNVFDRACTTCHGANASGGLDFRAPGTYARIVGVPAPDDPGLSLVNPGDRTASFLWLKVEKGTAGGHDEVSGPGMPIGPSLPPDVVEALGRWIDAGAPETGIVPGAEALTGACP